MTKAKQGSSSDVFILFLLITSCTVFSCTADRKKSDTRMVNKLDISKNQEAGRAALVRGHYLVDIIGCHDCHSPKVVTLHETLVDTSRLLSGHPAGSILPKVDKRAFNYGYWMLFSSDLTASVGDWGINYSSNLTPDSASGIGTWTKENFVSCIRMGTHMGLPGGRTLLPPMPWRKFAKMTDEDLEAIYTYLRTIPPIYNEVPSPVPPVDKKAND